MSSYGNLVAMHVEPDNKSFHVGNNEVKGAEVTPDDSWWPSGNHVKGRCLLALRKTQMLIT